MVDMSEQYREMCRKATEIQEHIWTCYWPMLPSFFWSKTLQRVAISLWTPRSLCEHLDIVQHKEEPHIQVSIEQHRDAGIALDAGGEPMSETDIWLPTLDQLWSLISAEVEEPTLTALRLVEWLPRNEHRHNRHSPHQAMLSLVMGTKWRKLWVDGEWLDDGTPRDGGGSPALTRSQRWVIIRDTPAPCRHPLSSAGSMYAHK